MTRAAAKAGFETFVADTVDATRREFSLGRALRGTGLGLGGSVLDRLRENADALERRVVRSELDEYRQRSVDQFAVVLDYVQSDDPIGAFEDKLLAHDSYVDSIDDDASEAERQAVVADVLDRLERLGDGVEPIVDAPEAEFFPALRTAYDRETALELVDETFPFTGPLRDHRRAIAFTAEIDPGAVLGGPLADRLPGVSVEYTDEALRAMRRAEQQVVADTKAEIRQRYGPIDPNA